jgi:hypothetical protein
MKLLVDGEPAQNAGGDWVLGKLSDKVCREIVPRNT